MAEPRKSGKLKCYHTFLDTWIRVPTVQPPTTNHTNKTPLPSMDTVYYYYLSALYSSLSPLPHSPISRISVCRGSMMISQHLHDMTFDVGSFGDSPSISIPLTSFTVFLPPVVRL